MAVNLRSWSAVDNWLGAVGRVVFPPSCALCGEHSATGRDLCAACAVELPFNRSCCARCALPLATPALACGECLRKPPPFDAAIAPLRYEWPLDRLVTRLKFSVDLAVGRVLAELLQDAVRSAADRIDLVVPVPLHLQRLRERGFNQALELARPIARRLGLPLDHAVLARTRATPPQTGLAAAERRRNLRDAFAVRGTLAGRSIALVDDVVTTTATVRACARALKQAGAGRVEVWAVARAAGPRA